MDTCPPPVGGGRGCFPKASPLYSNGSQGGKIRYIYVRCLAGWLLLTLMWKLGSIFNKIQSSGKFYCGLEESTAAESAIETTSSSCALTLYEDEESCHRIMAHILG